MAPTPCRRGFACPYLRRRCCFFGHSPEEVAAESKVGRDHPVLGRDVAATASLDELMVRVARLERVVEQIAGSPVPQILGERVQNRTPEQAMDVSMPQTMEDSLPFVPQERVQNRTPEQIVDVPVPQIMEDTLPFIPQERVQSRTLEQIVDFPVPRIMEAIVEEVSSPQERVQNRTLEQIVDFPVPRIMKAIAEVGPSPPLDPVQNRTPEQLVDVPVPQMMEAIVENYFPEQLVDVPVPQILEAAVDYRFPEQTVNFPVSQNMEAYAGRVRATPQERVQNRIPELVVDAPLPHIKQGAVFTGKVFTVKLRHHRDDHASSDNVGFIKGLDKNNMPRFGDVMVPPPQIIKGFLGHVAAKRSGRSSRAKLKR